MKAGQKGLVWWALVVLALVVVAWALVGVEERRIMRRVVAYVEARLGW